MKKLTQQQKEEILALKGQEGQSTRIVAERFGVSNSVIWHIWNPQIKNNPLDTTILKKMIKPFAKAKINIKLEKEEQERIKELFEEVKQDV